MFNIMKKLVVEKMLNEANAVAVSPEKAKLGWKYQNDAGMIFYTYWIAEKTPWFYVFGKKTSDLKSVFGDPGSKKDKQSKEEINVYNLRVDSSKATIFGEILDTITESGDLYDYVTNTAYEAPPKIDLLEVINKSASEFPKHVSIILTKKGFARATGMTDAKGDDELSERYSQIEQKKIEDSGFGLSQLNKLFSNVSKFWLYDDADKDKQPDIMYWLIKRGNSKDLDPQAQVETKPEAEQPNTAAAPKEQSNTSIMNEPAVRSGGQPANSSFIRTGIVIEAAEEPVVKDDVTTPWHLVQYNKRTNKIVSQKNYKTVDELLKAYKAAKEGKGFYDKMKENPLYQDTGASTLSAARKNLVGV